LACVKPVAASLRGQVKSPIDKVASLAPSKVKHEKEIQRSLPLPEIMVVAVLRPLAYIRAGCIIPDPVAVYEYALPVPVNRLLKGNDTDPVLGLILSHES
jgi:hypothetical protein